MASGWPLRFKHPEELPMIAKFDEKVNFDDAKLPVKLYMKEEEILDEPEDPNLVKDSEYFKRKRQRRRGLRSKSMLIMEDSTKRLLNGPPVGLQYEGKLVNLNLADSEDSNVNYAKSKPKTKSVTEAPFKYVILQVVKTPSATTEVNVIPVGDWYSFKKPSVTGEKLLDEIDEDFELKQMSDRNRLARYRKINKTLESTSRMKEGGEEDDGTGMTSGGGYLIPSAFGRTNNKSLKSGAKTVQRRHMDEGGQDLDAAKEPTEWCGGDYSKTFADDEEENVGREQAELNDKVDLQAGREIVPIEEEAGNTGGNYDSDDDAESESGDGDDVGGLGTDGGLQYAEHVGNVNDDIEDSAKSYGMYLKKQAEAEKLAAAKRELGIEETTHTTGTTAQSSSQEKDHQRKRPAEAVKYGAETKASDETKGNLSKRIKSDGSLASASSAPATSQYALSEEGVKKYLVSMGGRANANALKEVFKATIKAHNKEVGDNKAGGQKLIAILLRVAISEEDPVLGKVLRLRDMSILQKKQQ